ncbi:type II toxin-antitoxin system ParD family antitoxin [Sphingomonas kyungheensis]|uniref:Type II toxin-antitoxin system ParD family antitoxin n=1 Tax=Sphingomonas kyungheensis TaxID=1069987 RepID=A0ABU8H4E2_9SPHN
MTTISKTIIPTEQHNAWLAAQIEAGSYTDDSDAIRDMIRREQDRRGEINALRHALIEGEQSGAPQTWDFAAFKQRKIEQYG